MLVAELLCAKDAGGEPCTLTHRSQKFWSVRIVCTYVRPFLYAKLYTLKTERVALLPLYIFDIGQLCYNELTAVKRRYPLTSIT